MRKTGVKRIANEDQHSTVAWSPKRRKPLHDTTGNTVPRRPSASDLVARKTSSSPQQPATCTTGLNILPPTCPLETTALWKQVYATRRSPTAESLRPHEMPPKEASRERVASSSSRIRTRRDGLEVDIGAFSETAVEEAEEQTTAHLFRERLGLTRLVSAHRY